jgi:acetylornithine/succinyldiaminopimelate/putrescine aminotransferase
MVEQAGKLTLTCRAFHNNQLAPFYEQSVEFTGSHKVLPMNSGAEAVESGIKSVRKWGYEVRLILLRAANLALQSADRGVPSPTGPRILMLT